jgi:spore maturation protein CgeB
MKILLLAWNRLRPKKKGNWNHELFRRELARQHDVIFWGIGYKNYDLRLSISDVIEKNPGIDFILTHFEHRTKFFWGLENIQNIPKVHICGGDYDEKTYEGWNSHFERIKYDMVFGRYTRMIKDLRKNGVKGKIYYLPWSVDTNKHYKQNIKKNIDVAAIFQAHRRIHPERLKLKKLIKKMGMNSFVGTAWFEDYVQKINESKIFVSANVKFPRLSGKYYEVLACGTFFLTTRPEDLERLGFKNGEHLVLYKDDFSDLKDKIDYFLEHEDEREEIAKNGMDFVRKNHSSEVRVRELMEMVGKELR